MERQLKLARCLCYHFRPFCFWPSMPKVQTSLKITKTAGSLSWELPRIEPGDEANAPERRRVTNKFVKNTSDPVQGHISLFSVFKCSGRESVA